MAAEAANGLSSSAVAPERRPRGRLCTEPGLRETRSRCPHTWLAGHGIGTLTAWSRHGPRRMREDSALWGPSLRGCSAGNTEARRGGGRPGDAWAQAHCRASRSGGAGPGPSGGAARGQQTDRAEGEGGKGVTQGRCPSAGGEGRRPTSSTATSCPLRSSRKVSGCLESSPGITSQPRRGMDTRWVFRSVLSLCRMSLLSLTLHQRSRQRLLESTFRWPAATGQLSRGPRPRSASGGAPGQARSPGAQRAWALRPGAVLPQVGTSSSAEEVCSSVDGFFFPRPMILVIFFPVTLDTVPLASGLEPFFLLTGKNNDSKKHVML